MTFERISTIEVPEELTSGVYLPLTEATTTEEAIAMGNNLYNFGLDATQFLEGQAFKGPSQWLQVELIDPYTNEVLGFFHDKPSR